MNIVEITLKLVLAVALGGLIGLERESSQKPAGFRTNILICIGTTMIMVLGSLILQDGNMVGSEISRLAAAAITGPVLHARCQARRPVITLRAYPVISHGLRCERQGAGCKER